MKKYITLILAPVILIVLLSSCVEDYLNKAPESGLNTTDVFSKYENFKKFFDAIYEANKLDGPTWRPWNIKVA